MNFKYVALNTNGVEINGEMESLSLSAAINTLKNLGMFPTKIIEIKPMNLSQALKQKNRLAGELVRQQQILQRENARRNDSTSTVNREAVWNKIIQISEELGVLKGKICKANINIYPSLEQMAELKSRIVFLNSLQKTEGEEIAFIERNQEKQVYRWNSFINQEACDKMVAELQEKIYALQDKVDIYNSTTMLPD